MEEYDRKIINGDVAVRRGFAEKMLIECIKMSNYYIEQNPGLLPYVAITLDYYLTAIIKDSGDFFSKS